MIVTYYQQANKMTKQNSLKRIAITGGPGVGKSTVLEILAYKGFQTTPEAARLIIDKELLQKDSDCLPWKNIPKFQNSVSELQLKLENAITTGIVFSDRGIVDGYAYSQIDKIPVPEVILKEGRNRYDFVFFLDRLPCYQKDNSRREDIQKATQIQQAIKSAYVKFGYTPVSVPVLSPEERVDFILKYLKGGKE